MKSICALPILTAAVLVVCCVGCPGFGGVQTCYDLSYGSGYVADPDNEGEWVLEPLLMDMYEPEERDMSSPAPAIILVHGGGFTGGSRDNDNIVRFAEYFARRGFVAFSVSYRLEDTSPPAPDYWDMFSLTSTMHAACVDVRVALRHVHANAETYNIDTDRIVLLGESAGAISGIAAIVANDGRFESDGEGYPVPAENNPDAPNTVRAYVHFWGGADHVLTNIDANTPPIMIVHGEDDNTFFASYGAAQRLRAVLRLAGVPHEWRIADDTGHGAWDYRSRGRNLRTLTYQFVEEHLGLD